LTVDRLIAESVAVKELTPTSKFSFSDLSAGLVVYLVALPLCLGVAKASDAPYFAGILAGIIGGIVVGALSGSHTSVSGPAAGLTAVVTTQIHTLGSFPAFLTAVVIGGLLQILMGTARLGFLSAFVPTAVIKGLLAAIGIILILKQIPHVLGHDADLEGDFAFPQTNDRNTFSEIFAIPADYHLGAAAIGLTALAVLIAWDRIKFLKKLPVPSPLVAVLLGVGMNEYFRSVGGGWVVSGNHLVEVPVADSVKGLTSLLQFPDFSQLSNPKVFLAGLTIAIVASLETLLNLEAVDRLDPQKRESPASRELVAQGIGNTIAGLVGGIPITSVIVRSSVNVNMGARSKVSAIFHGGLLLVSVGLFPTWINRIPLACLAAILLVTGFKLASPKVIRGLWREGREQFLPFAVTVVAIVLTDLLIGIVIGLAISIGFVLRSNLLRPMRSSIEKHASGEVLRIELASQVSFLNKAALERALLDVKPGGHVLLDARITEYIDPDVRHVIEEFKERSAPVRGVQVSLLGFEKFGLNSEINFVDYVDHDVQKQMTPQRIVDLLNEGNERFRTGRRISRDLGRQLQGTAPGQHPMAVVLSCIDSRTPTELIFDLGLGDIFSVRIAGNIVSRKVLGSIEYGCSVGGAKLVLVLGHTRCGAITAAVDCLSRDPSQDGAACDHLQFIVDDISPAVDEHARRRMPQASADEREVIVDGVARRHVQNVIESIREQSSALRDLEKAGKIKLIGGMYDVKSGNVELGIERPDGVASAAVREFV
jgi:carbonic anhydrase